MLTLASAVAPAPDVAFREINREAVLLNLATGAYFGLNATGTRAWQLLVAGEPLAAIHARLLREFEVAADALERDLLQWAEGLLARGLIAER